MTNLEAEPPASAGDEPRLAEVLALPLHRRSVFAAEATNRDQARSRARRSVRALTIRPDRTSNRARVRLRLLYPEATELRPVTRGDCVDGPRPCPWVGCRHHLYLDVNPTGSVKLNFPDLDPDELADSCALDVAERDGATLEEVAAAMNLTRERVRQIEMLAMRKLRRKPVTNEMREAELDQRPEPAAANTWEGAA